MGLQFSEIDDAVLLTQENLVKRGAFVDMQTDLTDHVAVREMWKGRQKKFIGGDDWEFQCQIDHNYSARAVTMYETDGSAMTDTMVTGKVNPRHINAHYTYDKREKAFQRGGVAIVDFIKTKYTAMMVSLYEYLETVLWSKPTNSTDNKTPFGIAYWVLKNAADSEGFHQSNPAGFTSGRANIDSTASGNERWSNWYSRYIAVEKQDLIRRMRTAHRNIQFRSPVSHSQPELGGMKNGIYAGDTVVGLMEELLEGQNMNLGDDLASKDGRTVFKSTSITYAPKLDDDSQDPVYMLDWKWLAIGVLAGWENELTKPYMVPNMHLVSRVDLDATLNMVSSNLRKQAVIAKA